MINVEKRRQRVRIVVGSILVLHLLYVGSYTLDSLAGGWMVNESGECRNYLVASCDQFVWTPRFGACQKFRWSGGRDGIRAFGIGYLYCPLILLDQAYFHQTVRFMDEGMTFVEPIPAPPIEEYHPTMVNRYCGRFPYRP